jgi:predicted GIY-YIG superfamily endonuclease
MSKSTLTSTAELVRTETIEGANSANRIGQLLKDMISQVLVNTENQTINIVITHLQSPVVPKASAPTHAQSQSGVEDQIAARISQGTGASTTITMSQKAATDALALKELASNKKTDLSSNSDSYFPTVKAVVEALALKVDKNSVVQVSGNSQSMVISQDGVTTMLSFKLDKSSVKSTTGASTTDVMSQKAVTDELALKEVASNKKTDLTSNSDSFFPTVKAMVTALLLKFDKTSVKSTTGASESYVMSQKAVTDELALKELASNKKTDLTSNSDNFFPTVKAMVTALLLKFDKTSVKNATGVSESDVMSQKAVTDELALKEVASNKKTDLTSNSDSFFPTVKAMVTALLLKSDKSGVENTERALADLLAHLLGRIETLEQELAESKYSTMQIDTLSVVSTLQFKGAPLILTGTSAPAVTPDFEGQFFIVTGGATYQANGITNSGNWKQISN